MKASLHSAVIWVVPRTVIDNVGMNLEREMVYDFLLTQQSWKPWLYRATSFFISIFLLPGTLLTGGLPSQLEIAIGVQRVCN